MSPGFHREWFIRRSVNSLQPVYMCKNLDVVTLIRQPVWNSAERRQGNKKDSSATLLSARRWRLDKTFSPESFDVN